MIKLQISGNLGKDCIVKEVNGKTVINFSVAHTEKFKDGTGNLKEKTTWVECAYWTDRTAVAQYLMKGKMVYAEGAPDVDAYSNKEGNPAATLRMRVQNLQLLGGNTEGNSSGGFQSQSQAAPRSMQPAMAGSGTSVAPDTDDDLPF